MRLRTSSALALAAVPAIALSACGSGGASTTTSTTTTPAPSSSAPATPASTPITPPPLVKSAQGEIAGVTVEGPKDKPILKLATLPVDAKQTTAKVVTPGSGAAITANDTVVTKVALYSGKTGKVLEDTFARGKTDQLPLTGTLVGLAKGMLDQKVGSRVLIAVAPSDGAALLAQAQGQPPAGLDAKDTMVALVDLESKLPTEASGKVIPPKQGLPSVTFQSGKPTTITVPKAAPPKQRVVQALVEGTGPAVKAGQTVSVTYTGVTWADGKKFDSSFDRGSAPYSFAVGQGQTIPAWDQGLVGVKVGSRVLIVAPPADAYGAKANGDIPANSTLVFVVDVLSAS